MAQVGKGADMVLKKKKKKGSRADMHTSDILQFPFTDEEPESKSD